MRFTGRQEYHIYCYAKMKERIYFFDYIKAFLITLVVLGHCMPENTCLHRYIYAWHMPAFFIINGILLRYTEFEKRRFFGRKGVFLSNIKKLMIPYYIYGSILLIVRWSFSGFDFSNLKWQLIDLFSLSGIGATWFLPCLFIAQLICFFILKFSLRLPNKWMKILIIILFIFGLLTLVFLFPIKNFIFLVLNRALLSSGFCLLGVVMFEPVMKLRHKSAWFVCLLSAVVLVLSGTLFVTTGQNDASINVLKIGNPFLFLLNSIIGSLIPISGLVILDKIKNYKFKNALAFFGVHSLAVMGTHQAIMLLLHIPTADNFLINLALCFLIMTVELPLCILIKKLKLIGVKHD